MIVLGSGGHTGEMIYLMEKACFESFTDIFVVHASSDLLSPIRFQQLCELNTSLRNKNISFISLPRPIDVHDTYIRAFPKFIFSLLLTSWYLIKIPTISHFFCNGPGVCIPPLFITYIRKLLLRNPTKIVFVESFCRVQKLSLSGRIAKLFADHFIVHWKKLQEKTASAEYFGFLF